MNHKSLSLAAALLSIVAGNCALAQQAVLQRGYDPGLSGANLSETTLNTSNVTPTTFGRIATLPADADVYAQPLYVPHVAVAGQGTHNVLYVASMNDTLYAYDADTYALLWSDNFATSVGATAAPIANFTFSGNQNIYGTVGILSTPVIDASTNLLYLVAGTIENSTLVWRLHVVDITSGSEPLQNVVVKGTSGALTFNGRYQTQRSSLTLSGNQVVFGFGAVELEFPGGYSGWVMSYNKQTLAQTGSLATVGTGTQGGGVWQSGRPPVVDSTGNIYVFTGNGYSSGYNGVTNFSESLLKINPAASPLTVGDWFTPANWSSLDGGDQDLASSGPMLIPNTGLIAGGGKAGTLYVLSTAALGHLSGTTSGPGILPLTTQFRGGPVYWQRSAANGGPLLYNWGANDNAKAYVFNGTTLVSTPASQTSAPQVPQPVYPGGILTLSANGDTPGTGILWGTVAPTGDLYDDPTDQGELYALDASNLGNMLWNSNTNSARDALGNFGKFVPPTVANGRVYVATFSNRIDVYGLLTVATPTLSPAPGSYVGAQQVTLADTTATAVIHYTTDGTAPSGSSPTYAVGTPITVSASETIEAIAVANGMINSAVAGGLYTITPVTVSFALSPSVLAFGNQTINSSTPLTVSVSNTGNGALPITGIALAGGSVGQFSQSSNCPSSVAVGGGCTITVVFQPISVGVKKTTLTVTSGSLVQNVAISGTSGAPTYTVTPSTLAFGAEATGVPSSPQSVVLTNVGTVDLPISSVALSGGQPGQFSAVNGCSGTLAGGASCSVQVTFLPTGSGDKSTTLKITTAGGAKSQSVPVSGTGVVPTFTLSPSAVPFGNVTHGTSSAVLPVTLTNTGSSALPIVSIAAAGAVFTQTNGCGTSVAAGSSCTINVTFSPTSKGSRSGTLKVTSSKGVAVQTVTLTGTGV